MREGRRGAKGELTKLSSTCIIFIKRVDSTALGNQLCYNIKNVSVFANSLFLKLTAEHAEMDWVPVNLDSPAGRGIGQRKKVSEPNFF